MHVPIVGGEHNKMANAEGQYWRRPIRRRGESSPGE